MSIVFKKIFAILIIKVYSYIVLITLDNLKFNKDNLNIKSCSCNNKEKNSLKKFKS